MNFGNFNALIFLRSCTKSLITWKVLCLEHFVQICYFSITLSIFHKNQSSRFGKKCTHLCYKIYHVHSTSNLEGRKGFSHQSDHRHQNDTYNFSSAKLWSFFHFLNIVTYTMQWTLHFLFLIMHILTSFTDYFALFHQGRFVFVSKNIFKRPARDACLCMGDLQALAAPHFVFLITL